MRHDAATYREVCVILDKLFKDHGEQSTAAVNKYLKIRRETRQTEQRIGELEDELNTLKKVDSISRKRSANKT